MSRSFSFASPSRVFGTKAHGHGTRASKRSAAPRRAPCAPAAAAPTATATQSAAQPSTDALPASLAATCSGAALRGKASPMSTRPRRRRRSRRCSRRPPRVARRRRRMWRWTPTLAPSPGRRAPCLPPPLPPYRRASPPLSLPRPLPPARPRANRPRWRLGPGCRARSCATAARSLVADDVYTRLCEDSAPPAPRPGGSQGPELTPPPRSARSASCAPPAAPGPAACSPCARRAVESGGGSSSLRRPERSSANTTASFQAVPKARAPPPAFDRQARSRVSRGGTTCGMWCA